MKHNLIIISAGKQGREVFGWATDAIAHGTAWRIKGFLDDRAHVLDGFHHDTKIIGTVEDYKIEEDDVFIGAIGDPVDKVKYYTPILERGGTFINLIHPLANIGHNVQLGVGIVMAPFTCATSDVTIGDFVVMLPLSTVTHDAVIGNWCQISSHCAINGNVILGEGVFLGSHTCIVPNVKVGGWSYTCAGSVVTRDIRPRTKVMGLPARPFGILENK